MKNSVPQLLLICIIAFYAEEVCSSIYRLNKRISNVEVKLDTVNTDIAAFRLDMIEVWDKMEEMNKSMCPTENPNHLMKPNVTVMETAVQAETHVSSRMLYSALQSEKKFVREHNQMLEENVNALAHGQKHIEVLVKKQSENIEKVVQDIKTLNNMSVFKAEHRKAIGKVVKDIETIDSKILVMEHAQEDTTENVKSLTENIKTTAKDIKTLDQKVKKIDQLERDVKTLKETLDTVMNQMSTMQQTINQIKARTPCLPRWYSYGQSCYYFSTSELSWSDALNDCKSKGVYLAEHKHRGEAKDLAELAQSISTKIDMYWVGASDISSEGSWIWKESHASVNYSYWTSGNPDNYRNEDCMSTYVNHQGHWNDLNCNTKIGYICQTAKLD
ncbi:C-type lectin domain family 4 member G-like [Mercenaria mercenaria]|uniref:C-type lectin domain family 4 member G-like n=1 Tax=Mercenaria mercenaria TaxID=6596 RepID=UPI00234EAD3A|nr:C-type lectin domain family 4 member G-like [Mercenaria mercenaria]